MKKFKMNNRLRLAFWTALVLAILWVAFVPHRHHVMHPAPTMVQVHRTAPSEDAAQPAPGVEISQPEPPEVPGPVSSGEEKTPQAPAVHNESLLVPVIPEKQEPLSPGHRPKIAIVIDDVGPDLRGSEKAIKLPAPVTLSFLPYAVRVREQAKEARDAGHELLLHMPMEPIGREDPGPGALLVDLPMEELQQRLQAALSSFTGFDGVNNHMGSKFTAYADGMSMVVDELQQRHLFFLDSRTSAKTVGKMIADQKGAASVGRDVFLDDDQSPDAIRKQLEITEKIARRKGAAVAIGHPHATTMSVLSVWSEDAARRGFELVPLRTLVKGPKKP